MTCLGAAGGGVPWKSGLGWRAEVQEQEAGQRLSVLVVTRIAVIQDVWRTEAEIRSFDDSIFLPALTAVGVTMRSRRSFRSGRWHARDSGPDAVAK